MSQDPQTTRPLTETEAAFAAKVREFGELLPELQRLAAKVKEENGDPQFAILSQIESEEERAFASANWPMLSLVFGL